MRWVKKRSRILLIAEWLIMFAEYPAKKVKTALININPIAIKKYLYKRLMFSGVISSKMKLVLTEGSSANE
jgi:hypothetical protein